MNYLHYEVEEHYKDILDMYGYETVRDLVKIPHDELEKILMSEFDHVCEDFHYSYDYDKWKRKFMEGIRG